MADAREGLSTGGVELDPNDARGFEQIMAGKGVQKIEGEGEGLSTDIRSGLTTHEPGQGRGSNGQFVPEGTPEPVKTPPVAAPAVAPAEGESDPEIEALLAKYNGDPVAALKAAASAQSVIGRQGAELGKTREELAELRGLVEGIRSGGLAPAAAPLSQDQVDEVAQTRIDAIGYSAAATEAANYSLESGDERAYKTIWDQWNLEDPFAAQTHIADFRSFQRQRAVEAPAVDEWAQSAATRQLNAEKAAALEEPIKALREEYGDVWPLVAAQMDTALETMPENVLKMIDSLDPEARAAGLRIVADRATLLASNAPAPVAAAAKVEPPELESAAVRKLRATVASGALRPATAAKPTTAAEATPEDRDEAIKDFKRQIMESETTSVRSGLTFGK